MAQPPATRRPRPVLIVAVLLVLAWLGIGGVGGSYTGKLTEVQTNDNSTFLPDGAESTRVADITGRMSDTEEIPLILVVEGDGGKLTAEQSKTISDLAGKIAGTPVRNVDEGATVADYVTGSGPVVAVPSQDGQAALISVALDGKKVTSADGGEQAILSVTEAIREATAEDLKGTGLTGYVGGPAGLISDFGEAFAGIDGILLGVALLVVLIILLIVYRSPILPFAVLLSAIFGLALASVFVYALAVNDVITLNGQSQGIMFILVVGAATDYALLLVSRFREELHDHANSWDALRNAWRGSVEPILASGLTVAAALLCLLFATMRSTAGLGPVGALGIMGALLATLTFLPAVLVIFGRRVFWPFVPKVDHVHEEDKAASRGLWGRVARLVGTHPRRTWVLTLVALLFFAAFAPTFRASGVSIDDTFLTKTESVEANQAIGRHFSAGAGSPVQVVVPQDKAQDALKVVEADKGITGAFIGVVPPTPGAPAVPPPVVDGDVLIQGTTTAAFDSADAEDTVTRLRRDLDSVSPDALVGGQTAVSLDSLNGSTRDFAVLVPTILFVIFVILIFLLRSIVAPLLLVASNVISFGATIGIAALLFNHVFGFGGSDPVIPLYGFVFLVALGIDYSIFLMSRVREESAKRGTRPGILVGLAVTGGVITSAGIVLASTFSALAVLPLVFLVQIAFIVAFGVLLDTIVVRSLLVPAAAYDIGPKLWWPRLLASDTNAHDGKHAAPGDVSYEVTEREGRHVAHDEPGGQVTGAVAGQPVGDSTGPGSGDSGT